MHDELIASAAVRPLRGRPGRSQEIQPSFSVRAAALLAALAMVLVGRYVASGAVGTPAPAPAPDAGTLDAGTLGYARPGTSRDNPLDRPRDLTGRSIKTPRVRAVHTTDVAQVGGTAYLTQCDPWLAYQRGRELFLREFSAADGVFGESGRQSGPKLEDGASRMASRDHASSCAICHNSPWRDAGAGATFAKNGGRGRNTPHLFGAGLIEMLGWQSRLKLLAQVDANRDGWISPAEAKGRAAWLEPVAQAARIPLGRFDDADHDGRPDLDPALAVWYVDARGQRIPWARKLTDPGVAGYSFEYQVFGHGNHPGQTLHGPPTPSTLRAFTVAAYDLHAGLQAFDPTFEDPDGDGLAGVSQAGAPQFATAGGRDRGAVRDAAGVSLDDPDRDGHPEEISEGDLDLAEWYQLNHPRPAERARDPGAAAGRRTFDAIGCARCHTPDWQLEAAAPAAKDPHLRYPGDRRYFDLDVSQDVESSRLVGRVVSLAGRAGGRWTPRRGAFTVRGLYSDLATHDLGDAFAEVQFDGSVIRRHRTAPLWGAGSTAPYGHDGASLDLDAAIRRHGGEAAAVTAHYTALAPAARAEVEAFLRSLVLYSCDDLPVDWDGDGRIAPHFLVAGVDTGEERFNPEWAFRVPGRIEGPVTAPDGARVVSQALTNAAAAYGVDLPYLRDTDGDGFPDVRDAEPLVPGYRPGARAMTGPSGGAFLRPR